MSDDSRDPISKDAEEAQDASSRSSRVNAKLRYGVVIPALLRISLFIVFVCLLFGFVTEVAQEAWNVGEDLAQWIT
jgi:hypothetical protein